jgi:hypothetical protein
MSVDSALNEWVQTIPDHRECSNPSCMCTQHRVVRWDPQNPDLTFFDQSAVLYTHYFYTQILVHRPFVTHLAARTSSSIAYLAICANAARSCTRVMDTQTRRGRVMTIPNVTVSIFLIIV